MVQIGHAFDQQWDRHFAAVKRAHADRDAYKKDRDDVQLKLEAAVSELDNLRVIAQDKERELASEREKTKRAMEESSVLKGTVESLSSRMAEMEKGLSEAEEKAMQTEARAEVEAKGRVYPKFLAGTLSKEVAERRFGYSQQLVKATRATLPSPDEDSDSEKDFEEEDEEEKEKGDYTPFSEGGAEEVASGLVEENPISAVPIVAAAAPEDQGVEEVHRAEEGLTLDDLDL